MSPLSDFPTLSPDFSIETELQSRGHQLIAGIDEAGRGALAGPLSLGMVIYPATLFDRPPEKVVESIADSKKLSAKKRIKGLSVINEHAMLCVSVFVPHTVIDELNINGATKYGIDKLLAKSPVKPDIIIMDGNFRFKFDIPFLPVIKGDNRSLSIASASIVAKVRRDQLMERLDLRFPGYGFSGNKGYGAKSHLLSISERGFSVIHRKSYEPVRSILEGQRLLFDEDNG